MADVDKALVDWTTQNESSPIKFDVDTKAVAGLQVNGKVRLFSGRTGEPFEQDITVLLHVHPEAAPPRRRQDPCSRSTGPYSLVTEQPLGGKAQFGGQCFGEMEVWCSRYTRRVHAPGDAHDQVRRTVGRGKAYSVVYRQGRETLPSCRSPSPSKAPPTKMQSLALDPESEEGHEVEVRERGTTSCSARRRQPGIDLSPGSLRAAARQPTAQEAEEGQDRVDTDGSSSRGRPTSRSRTLMGIHLQIDDQEDDAEPSAQPTRPSRSKTTCMMNGKKEARKHLIDINGIRRDPHRACVIEAVSVTGRPGEVTKPEELNRITAR